MITEEHPSFHLLSPVVSISSGAVKLSITKMFARGVEPSIAKWGLPDIISAMSKIKGRDGILAIDSEIIGPMLHGKVDLAPIRISVAQALLVACAKDLIGVSTRDPGCIEFSSLEPQIPKKKRKSSDAGLDDDYEEESESESASGSSSDSSVSLVLFIFTFAYWWGLLPKISLPVGG